MASKSGGTTPTPTTTNLSPSDIAVRIAKAMGWKEGDNGYNTEEIPCCVWHCAESDADAVGLLEILRNLGWRYDIRFDTNGNHRAFFVNGGFEGCHVHPSFARAVAIAVMLALESSNDPAVSELVGIRFNGKAHRVTRENLNRLCNLDTRLFLFDGKKWIRGDSRFAYGERNFEVVATIELIESYFDRNGDAMDLDAALLPWKRELK